MSMLAEGLARSGALGAPAMASVVAFEGLVEPAVLAHPLVVRSALELPIGVVGRALELDPPAGVVDELLAAVDPRIVVGLANQVCSPRLIRELDVVAAAGSTAGAGQVDARWVQLRIGDLALREDLVVALAPEVGVGVPGQVLTWFAAATACPHLLAGLSDVLPTSLLGAAVARFAKVAASGGSPAEVFTAELIAWQRGHGAADWAMGSGRVSAPPWGYTLWCTGLEGVAAAALAEPTDAGVQEVVLTHPRLGGSPVAVQLRKDALSALGDVHLPDDVVTAGAPVLVTSSPDVLLRWVATGHDSSDEVALAWAALRPMVGSDSWQNREAALPVAVVTAAELACMDAADGPVWREALTWALEHAARGGLDVKPRRALEVLTKLAAVVHEGASLGGVGVHDLSSTRDALVQPSWIGSRVGEFLAGVPGIDDLTFVQALLAAGAGFTGTFDELVAVATAVAA